MILAGSIQIVQRKSMKTIKLFFTVLTLLATGILTIHNHRLEVA